MGGLTDKTAIVVGAGRGLGRSIALAFAREDVSVAIASRTESEIHKVADELRTRGRGRVLAVKTDATDYEQANLMVRRTVQEFGKVDVLVNCQGTALIKPTIQTTVEDWSRIVNGNLTSVFNTCRAVLPQMLNQKSGHIINISSRAGVTGAGGVAAYSAAKAGVIGLSKALAHELKAANIKVNVICPAPMDTPMRWESTPQFDHAKAMKPEYIAEFVVLIASMPDIILEDVLTPTSINY
jgi:NAD(P)-dependent dehydrogenase (short-subunit alcohol dehydrogenase family)